ncbi:MAG: amidohydrolase family protein [Gemmatimonadaceae bacterium]|nr:amidohydrolase family protein [Gemmatimonadaceae bacterium]
MLVMVACSAKAPAADGPYDLVITNGRIVDGTGNPFYYGDVGVRGDRIATIAPRGALANAAAVEKVDASGLVVSPGFIDIQSHSWSGLLFADGRVIGKVSQGVTTEILGEATTPAPSNANVDSLFAGGDPDDALMLTQVRTFRGDHGFGQWLAAMERHGISVNAGSYLGATTVRGYAMGRAEGAASAAALDTMRSVVTHAMLDGAFGVSSALIYPPGSYANTDELIEIAKAMSPLHGTYITHMRGEEGGLLGAIDEALRIGKDGGVPVVIYHFKAAGQRNWPLATPAIAKVDSARRAGLDVKATMYSYPASGNNLSSCIPGWVHADGKLIERVQDVALKARIRREMTDLTPGAASLCQDNPPNAYQIAGFKTPEWKQYEGKRLDAIAADMKMDWVDAIIALTIGERNTLGKVTFGMSEANVAAMIARPWVVIGSDAGGHDPDTTTALVHPRSYGTFTRVLGKYARDEPVLTLEDAVRKMTWSTAQILGLRDRGLITEGSFADIVIFDAASVVDKATFDTPHQLSVGVRDVFVNGIAVWRNNTHTGKTPGRAVYGPGWDGQTRGAVAK